MLIVSFAFVNIFTSLEIFSFNVTENLKNIFFLFQGECIVVPDSRSVHTTSRSVTPALSIPSPFGGNSPSVESQERILPPKITVATENKSPKRHKRRSRSRSPHRKRSGSRSKSKKHKKHAKSVPQFYIPSSHRLAPALVNLTVLCLIFI